MQSWANLNLLFTTDDNLSNSLINEIKEGADETIWIATEDGLCRFDGSQFITYRNDPANPNSLQNDFVRTLCTDDEGHVLVGTLSGVQMYRPETDDFTPIIIDPEQQIGSGNISDLCKLSNGDFMATGNVTFTIHFDEHGQPHAIPNPLTSHASMAYRCCEDYSGNVWVIKFEDGMYRLDKQGNVSLASLPSTTKSRVSSVLVLVPTARSMQAAKCAAFTGSNLAQTTSRRFRLLPIIIPCANCVPSRARSRCMSAPMVMASSSTTASSAP